MVTVAFVRHGITDWNIEGRAQGMADIPLNATGRAQAQALAARLQHEKWDVIYSSDLSRARETAEIIACPLHLPVQENTLLRERDQGKIEGTTSAERLKKWGEKWRDLDLNIESDESLQQRGIAFLTALATDENDGKRILAVSHGGLIGFTVLKLLPRVVEAGGLISNSSLTLLRYDVKWKCDLYNCTVHLPSRN